MSARESQDLPRRIADLDGRDAYALLGVPPSAGPQEIAAAYKREMARAHPDRGGSARRAQLVNCAYEVLTQHRDSYDALLDDQARVLGPDVLYIEPDAEPLDDPAPRRLAGSLAGGLGGRGPLLLAAVAVVAAVTVAAVVMTGGDDPADSAAWTTTGTGWSASVEDAPAAVPPSASPSTLPPSASPSTVPPSVSPAVSSSVPATAVVAAATAQPGGGGHRCEVHADGSLWCAGGNASGQLGNGTTQDAAVPVRAGTPEQSWTAVSVGGGSSCGLQADQSLWCWGDNTYGQLGDGTNSARSTPVAVDPAGRWVALSVDRHVCAVAVDGSLWCWGSGSQGELGEGGVDRASPARLGAGSTWATVSVGDGWTCAVRQDGGRQCWGKPPTAG